MKPIPPGCVAGDSVLLGRFSHENESASSIASAATSASTSCFAALAAEALA